MITLSLFFFLLCSQLNKKCLPALTLPGNSTESALQQIWEQIFPLMLILQIKAIEPSCRGAIIMLFIWVHSELKLVPFLPRDSTSKYLCEGFALYWSVWNHSHSNVYLQKKIPGAMKVQALFGVILNVTLHFCFCL